MNKQLSLLISAVLLLSCLPGHTEDIEKHHIIRMISYNIHHGEGRDGIIDIKRIAEVIAQEDPDLVALQEVDKNCARSGKRDLAAELGKLLGMQHIFGKAMDFQGGEYGLAILSKLPVIETNIHQLPKGDEPRRALEVKVKLGNYPKLVSYISIHNSWTNEDIRIKQIKKLLRLLGKPEHPTILAGDFNAKRGDDSLQLLKHAGWKILNSQIDKISDARASDPQIDFFVISNFSYQSVKSYVIDETLASDHRPIFAEIVF